MMQYLVKGMMLCVSNGILGAFAGMYLKIMYHMMSATDQVILGVVLFFLGIGVMIAYNVLLKKFVIGKENSFVLPLVCMLLGIWFSWHFYALS